MLQGEREQKGQTVAEAVQGGSLFGGMQEDFTGCSVREEPDDYVDLVAGNGKLVCKGYSFVGKAFAHDRQRRRSGRLSSIRFFEAQPLRWIGGWYEHAAQGQVSE